MPPPPPDRREFLYRDGRRHDAAAGEPLLPAPPATPRWRDSPYHPPPPPPPLRDHARHSPRRTASSASSEGYYRQGTGAGAYDRSYPDEPIGYTPSRSDRYWLEDDPPAGYKGFSRYGGGGGRRDGRDLRGSYRRSPFRSYGGDFPRGHQEPPPPPPLRRSPLRSVAVPICYDPPSDRADREDKEHQPRATPWRPLRRRESRSDAADAAGAGPLSVRQSAAAGSASEKNAPAQSDAAADSQTAEEEAPRKKPRLGWGQGLAKYEKQKVPGSADSSEPVAEGSQDGVEQKEPESAPALCASPVAAPAAASSAPPLCASPVAAPAAPSSAPALCASPVAAPAAPSSAPALCASPVAAPAAPSSAPALCASPVAAPAAPSSAPALCASPVAAPAAPSSAPALCASPVDAPAAPSSAPALCASPVVAPAAPLSTPALCASPVLAPAAPSSAPPSSSPVPEDKSCELTANTVTVSNKDIPGAEVQAYNDEIPIKLGQLDGDRIGSLANVLAELLQHEDSCSGDSRRLTNSSKLLLLKENIARELEKTELEIDSLECELKSVSNESGNKALEDAENPSPSSGTSKVLAKPEICGTSSSPKEQGVLSPCKLSVEQEADANGVDLMDVVTAPVHSVTAVSSAESVACPGVVAEAEVAVAADVAPLKPSEGTGSQIDAHCPRQEPSSSHDNVSSMKADGSNDLLARQCSHRNLIPSIIAVNNDIAKEFNELVFKPLPAGQPCLGLSSQMKNDLIVRKKLGLHKNRLRFKEQALTFKFKVLRHLWKEDVRLLSVRKQRPKSNKRTDQSNRASQSGSQRQRSSNRSRLGMPAGNLNENEKESASFVSKNGLIEDPVSVEKERSVINPWTHEEKEVFMQMLASFGKNFSKISNFLQHKTTADCVEFYYKHHKSDSFREVKKLLDLRQQQPTSNYLGSNSGKKWNPENAASLDMLGNAASVVAAHGLDYANRVEKDTAKSIIRTSCRSDVSAVAKGSLDRDGIANVSLHERESVAADVLAGICGTLSPEGMGSCITSSADHGQKIGATRMDYLMTTPEADKSFDEEDTLSDQECEVDSVDWNDNEKSLFIEALNNHGKDFARISSYVKSKSYEQCKVFFSKARISLGLDLIYQRTTDVGLPTGDANGGTSDTDEACAAEMDSPICSTESPVEMEMEACPSADKTLQGHPLSGITFKQSETDRSDGPDIVDLTFEEGEIKAEDTKNCNIPVDHTQSIEATHQSTPSCAPIDINSSESTGSMENREHSNQVSVHGNRAMASSTEQPVGAHLEISSSLHNVEVIEPSKASEKICTQICSQQSQNHRVSNTPGPKDMNKFPVFNEQSRSQHDVLFRNIDGYLQHRRHLAVDMPAFSDSTVSGSVGTSHPDQFTITKYQNGRSGSSGLSSTSAGFLMNGSSKELREGQLKPCSHKASTESSDQVKRPGDVKLFGKILSHQSSLQSSGSSSNVTRSKPPASTAAGLLGSGMDRMVYSSRLTNTAHLGQDERVVRSYTHLDGSTVQPESSLFRAAKCQRSSLSSVPFYSAKNGTLGVFGEYQQPLRQQLPSDPKRLESYADLQKRNGMELISGFQQQQQQPGKAARLGGAGILVSPVSDPVAALKAQYGSSSKFLGQDADHPWKDIGNR
ncbi:hypothetical protein ZWY2020_037543 [Hordeum vulgare]|nr:hypothetical protein ZWY2020_037543 [Hordeum vulgare]